MYCRPIHHNEVGRVRIERAGKPLTHDQQRQIERMAPHVNRIVASDRAFFENNRDRRHLVRRTSEAEIAELEVVEGGLMPTPPKGWRWFTIVRKVPGGRARVFVTKRKGAKTGLDVPEDLACALFESLAPPELRRAEAAARAAEEAQKGGEA